MFGNSGYGGTDEHITIRKAYYNYCNWIYSGTLRGTRTDFQNKHGSRDCEPGRHDSSDMRAVYFSV